MDDLIVGARVRILVGHFRGWTGVISGTEGGGYHVLTTDRTLWYPFSRQLELLDAVTLLGEIVDGGQR